MYVLIFEHMLHNFYLSPFNQVADLYENKEV
jgi:DUF1365 family protein